MAAYFPETGCSDKVWKWNWLRVNGMPFSDNVPPTCGTAMTVCPLFSKVNDVSFRERASALSFGSTTVPTMSTGDCRVPPHCGVSSTQKLGPSPNNS